MFGHAGAVRRLLFIVGATVFATFQVNVVHGQREAGYSWQFNGYGQNAAPCNGGDEMDVFRLPDTVVPERYAIHIRPNFEEFTFAGQVVIAVKVVELTQQVVLNLKDLNVTEVTAKDLKTGRAIVDLKYRTIEKNEQFVIEAGKPFLANRNYNLTIVYNAKLRNDMSGFYRSSYKQGNDTKWLAVTQFEPTYARRAFPCFDEPALKAMFTVAVRRQKDQIALSNLPLSSTQDDVNDKNFVWDHFQESPAMSTYLVAFFVGEFQKAVTTRSIAVYTHADYITQTDYIVGKAANLLNAMEDYIYVPYSLPKMDLLAIPDFKAGAMENWGMNTYRERLLLSTNNTKSKSREAIVTVVQHELSHQWFGDLVTCAWWSDTWLNEGFATFFEYFAAEKVEPEWRLEDTFIYEVHQWALEVDQKPTHPISSPVKTLDEIKEMFDSISYSKAGAVLRMIKYIVTEDIFRASLHNYLQDRRFKAATPKDLWNAFSEVLSDNDIDLGVDFYGFATSWTEQSGYPLISVEKSENTFVVSQERFLITPPNETDTTLWSVGLTYTTEAKQDFTNTTTKVWLTTNKTTFDAGNEEGWYLFNLKSTGFYRVNYDVGNWNALTKQLKNKPVAINVFNRAQLLDDSFNLARADILSYTVPLELTTYLDKEEDMLPWYSAKDGLAFLLYRMRRDPDSYSQLEAYASNLAGTVYKRVESLIVKDKTTEHIIKTSWNAFSNWACRLENQDCTASALNYFNKWQNEQEIPADIRDAALCVGVKNGNSTTWNSVLEVYKTSDDPSDRQSALLALGCSKETEQLSIYLDFMFQGENGPIRQQDFRVIYQSIAFTPQGLSVLIDFLTNKTEKILNEVVHGDLHAMAIYHLLASRVALDNEIAKMDGLRNASNVPLKIRERFDKAFKQVEDNLIWFETNQNDVSTWARKYSESLTTQPPEPKKPDDPEHPEKSATTIKPPKGEPSSALANSQVCTIVLYIITFTWVAKTFYLKFKRSGSCHTVENSARTMTATIITVILLIFCNSVFGIDEPVKNGDAKMDVFKLPNDIMPESYDLTIDPNFEGPHENFTFQGDVTIVVAIKAQSTRVITLNSKDLSIVNVSVSDVQSRRLISVVDIVEMTKNEQLEIHVKEDLVSGQKYYLKISFAGKLRNDMTGFYKSSYTENNATKWLAVTQFEPTYARRAFPCYDEPSIKVPFDIKVIRRYDQIALSNMPLNQTDTGRCAGSICKPGDKVVDRFYTTPPVSTYLVSFYVGEFQKFGKAPSTIQLYARKEYINQTKYIWTEAPKLLSNLESYTNISLMLPKIDLLAIPDFAAGAMENWGMNTYREICLLFKDVYAKTKLRMRGAMVVQHELTHTWFGDLVTCSWWDYLWLNEGFARYFQYFASSMSYPDWYLGDLFVVEQHQTALSYDQEDRHAITAKVKSPQEIQGIFDIISYNKAASVLRMLNYVLTENIFKKSLQLYLKDNAYNATVPAQLFNSMQEVVDKEHYSLGVNVTVANFMRSWTEQPGYPVLSIRKENNTFVILQERFLSHNESSGLNKWLVGLTYTTENSKNFSSLTPAAWAMPTENQTVIPAPKQSGWYVFNIQSSGFYRVNYDADNWLALIKQLNDSPKAIHVLNRAQLIDDSFNLAIAGKLNFSVPLTLSTYLEKEDDIIPWYSAKNGFTYLLEKMRRNEQEFADLKAYVSRLSGVIYEQLEYRATESNYLVRSSWDAFSLWACQLENEHCTKTALNYYNRWKNGEKIPADIKDAAFCVGIRNNPSADWDKLFKLYTTTTSTSKKLSIQTALACSKNKTKLSEYIQHVLDGPLGPIRSQDYTSVISAISSTPLGIEVLTDFLSNNLTRVLSELFNGDELATFIYSTLAKHAVLDKEIDKLQSLKNKTSLPANIKQSFDKSFATTENNVKWFNTHSTSVSQWTTAHKKPSSPGDTEDKKEEKSSAPSNASASTFVLLVTVFVIFLKHL
ncbi:uncharacterized protein LOC126840878 [Adelges cooleyi]|uniref:uncharacterized protein LOC126840878 n=1 Tax=Adelges cooleyi TaxID=133065 RepID=UPI00217FAD2E|nr:uncharacterized protein LOC126840878 [Adelges cooleyi]